MRGNHRARPQAAAVGRPHLPHRGITKTIALAIGMLLGLAAASHAEEPTGGRGAALHRARDPIAHQTGRIAQPLSDQDHEIDRLYDEIIRRAGVPLSDLR
jgi:hypothetical protein